MSIIKVDTQLGDKKVLKSGMLLVYNDSTASFKIYNKGYKKHGITIRVAFINNCVDSNIAWRTDCNTKTNTLTIFIYNLRNTLKASERPIEIGTVGGKTIYFSFWTTNWDYWNFHKLGFSITTDVFKHKKKKASLKKKKSKTVEPEKKEGNTDGEKS